MDIAIKWTRELEFFREFRILQGVITASKMEIKFIKIIMFNREECYFYINLKQGNF